MGSLVVGVDAGGTSTRAVVLDLSGRRLGAGRAGGANPNSHPPRQAAEQVGAAISAALAGLDPAEVGAAVLGVAGSSKLTDPTVAGHFQAAWTATGLTCPMRVITDSEAAFASGTAEPDGTVLVAGTGSIAARVEGHRLVRTTGGYGWLLGDEGSAFWLGREAVRATLRALEEPGPVSGLPADVLAALLAADAVAAPLLPVLSTVDSDGVTRRQVWSRLITAANAAPPIALAGHAPLVSAAAERGDAVALAVLARAAELLVDTALGARLPGERTPVVLVGSLVGAGPLGERLRAGLAERAGGEVLRATDGAAGAAWLAAVDLLGPTAPRPQV